jgi:predicted TIM-barrel fold metal-dependent hydrolase
MRGLRLFTTTETEGTWLDDPRTFPVWERAGSLGIPICIMALTGNSSLEAAWRDFRAFSPLPV